MISFGAYSALFRGNPTPCCSEGDLWPPLWLISCAPSQAIHAHSLSAPCLCTPSYWKALAPTSLPCKCLPSSSVISSSLQTFLCAFHGVPIPTPRKTSLPESLLSLCWSVSLVDSDSLRARTRGHCTLPLPHTIPGAL